MREKAQANNGTIMINGIQINAVEITNFLNPELMKGKLKLPNGVEIPATKYIQEVVAPHIPSNGYFILRSNGAQIPAIQFIEEAVIGEGQVRYNGNIEALLEDMTIPKTKPPRGNVKEQVRGGVPKAVAQRRETDKATGKAEKIAAKQREDIEEANEEGKNNKYGVQGVKAAIERTHVTITEVKKLEDLIAKRNAEINEMKKLKFRGSLTPEQQARLAELQSIYLNRQNKQRGHSNDKGMGMSL